MLVGVKMKMGEMVKLTVTVKMLKTAGLCLKGLEKVVQRAK